MLNTVDWPTHYSSWASLPIVYTMGLARGCCAPFEPPASRAAAEVPDGRGRSPRAPAPCAHGGAAHRPWSPPTSARRSGSPSARPRWPSGSPTPGAGLRRCPRTVARPPGPLRGPRRLRRLRRPPPRPAAGGAASLPAGICRAAGAGWERPPKRQKGRQKPSVSGPSIRRDGGGSLPAPFSRQNGEDGSEEDWPKANGAMGGRASRWCPGSGKSSGKRWVPSFCRNMPTPKAAQRAEGSRAGPGSDGHRAMMLGGAPPRGR